MKKLRLISLVLISAMLCFQPIFAGVGATDVIKLDTFESYGNTLTGWTTPTTYGNVSLVPTDKGTSVRTQKTSSDGWHEVQRVFTETSSAISSVAYSCSIKFDGTPSMYFYTKSSGGGANGNGAEKWITQIDNGKITVGTTTSDAIIESGKWYDFFIEFNMQTGFTRCNITDGTNNWTVCDMPESFNALSKMFRISMALRAKTTLYFDNACFKTLKYNVIPHVPENKTEDFENGLEAFSVVGAGEDASASAEELSDSGRGKSVKLQNGGSENLSLGKTLNSLSGSIKISFDMMISESGRLNFGFEGIGADDVPMAESYPVKIEDGKLFADESEAGSIQNDKWYGVLLAINTSPGTYSFEMGAGEETISASGNLPEGLSKITSFEFMVPGGSNTLVVYIDNLLIKNAEGVSGYSPEYGTVGVDTSEFKVTFSDAVDPSCADSITVTLGDVAVPADNIKIDGNNLFIKAFQTPDFGEYIPLEFSGVKLLNGGIYGGMQLYRTEELCTVLDFAFSKPWLSEGELSGTARVSCINGNISDAMLIMILYDVKTGNMVAHNFSTASVGADIVPLTVSLTVPDDGGEYKAVMFLWDSMENMLALTNTLELCAEEEGGTDENN